MTRNLEKKVGTAIKKDESLFIRDMANYANTILEEDNLLVAMYGGSKLHGTADEKSDTDVIILYQPSLRSLVHEKSKIYIDNGVHDLLVTLEDLNDEYYQVKSVERKGSNCLSNDEMNVDLKFVSIFRFLDDLAISDVNALDILFGIKSNINQIDNFLENTHDSIYVEPRMHFSFNAVDAFHKYSSNIFMIAPFKFLGFVRSTLDDYKNSTDLENIEDIEKFLKDINGSTDGPLNNFFHSSMNFKDGLVFIGNVRFKEKTLLSDCTNKLERFLKDKKEKVLDKRKVAKKLIHAMRVLDELQELMFDGQIVFPLKNREYYKNIKSGCLTDEELNNTYELLESRYDSLKNAAKKYKKRLSNDENVQKFIERIYF